MLKRKSLITAAIMTVAMGTGAGLAAAVPATAAPGTLTEAAAGAPDVEVAASWNYYGTFKNEFDCSAMGFLLRDFGVADETMCQFYPGNPHVWKLYYR